MFKPKTTGARALHHEQQRQRILDSATLAVKFRALRSLIVETCHIEPGSGKHAHRVKYTVNLDHAKSAFHIRCANPECVGGDYDFSGVLDDAIAAGQQKVKGQLICPGWFNRNTINTRHCGQSLQYELKFGY